VKREDEQVEISSRDVFGPGATRFAIPAILGGLVALIVAFFASGSTRFLQSYHVSFCYFTSIALGGLFFVFVQHLTSAGWSVVVRRFAEIIMANLIVMAILSIPVLIGAKEIFPWMDAAHADALIAKKRAYLNPSAFYLRVAIYFILWGVLATVFLGRSVKQDQTGDYRITVALKRLSGPTAVLFAVSLTLFAFDMLMSLDPHWFSTIFGVYYFAGSVMAAFSALAIVGHITQRKGYLQAVIRPDHYHDLGKLMFSFMVFWTYIAFSQFMLIWYSNIPEETEWMLKRLTGEWRGLSVFLLVGHFMLPFAALISRYPKRRSGLLAIGAAWLLVMHWVDLYWLAAPEFRGGQPGVVPWAVSDVLCLAGMGSIFVGAGLLRARGLSLVPKHDPRLVESLAFENVGG
jgi:hypothetical protein